MNFNNLIYGSITNECDEETTLIILCVKSSDLFGSPHEIKVIITKNTDNYCFLIFPNHFSRLCRSLEEYITISDNGTLLYRAFDRQSKGLGLDTQRSGSVPFFTENFFDNYCYLLLFINNFLNKLNEFYRDSI